MRVWAVLLKLGPVLRAGHSKWAAEDEDGGVARIGVEDGGSMREPLVAKWIGWLGGNGDFGSNQVTTTPPDVRRRIRRRRGPRGMPVAQRMAATDSTQGESR
jgi:hypothetical protein